ncbi:MAG: hypothetical protein PHP00_08765 [Thiotrichaceae bacterium]|nr:hypothetical protein [Thiotrichaceae bacterium]
MKDIRNWVITLIVLLGLFALGSGNKELARLLGFSGTQIAAADILRQRLGDALQQAIGKGEIAIQEYENKIQDAKDKLIRIKVARKTYQPKLQATQQELVPLEHSASASEKSNLVRSSFQDMSNLLTELQQAESNLADTLKKMIDNLDTVKLKISTLQTKAEMLKIQVEIQDYTKEQTDIHLNDKLLEQMTSDLTRQIYTLQAQREVESVLKQVR